MPNWKKLYVSGSDALLNSVTTPQGTLNSFSASYALTASYALNGGTGGGGISAIYIADEGNVQGTASYFDFNGAGVTATVSNNTASITIAGGGSGGDTNSANAILNQTVAAVTWSFDHNLGTLYPVFNVYDANDDIIIPQKIHTVNTSSALIYFSSARTGTAVATKGGTVVTASAATSASYALIATTASYAVNSTSASYAAVAISASYAITSSYSVNSTSASYAVLATSGSYAVSSSYSLSGSYAVTASYAATASYAKNIIISGSISNADYIDFNTSATVTQPVVGRLSWNNTDGTLDLGMKGGNVTQQIGQEIFYEVRNETGTTINNGTVLYASGVTAGSGRITASPYTADGSVREVRLLGMATEDISNGVNGFVTHFGYIRGLDTRGTAPSAIAVGDEDWSVGDILYAHPTVAGKLTNIAPKHEISIAIVIIRHQSTGIVFIRPTSYGHMEDIHDVEFNSLSTGDLLIYDSGSDYWRNSKQLSGSYGLTGSLQATSLTGSLLGTASYAAFANTSSYAVNATTASYAINATTAQTASFANNFTVAGTLTAQTINVQTVSSSVVYSSGSNRFGNDLTNTQSITGSASITGSLQVNGSNVILSNQTSSMSVATASYVENAQTASYVLQAVSASYATSALTASHALTAPYSGLQGTVPTWNQNTTGTAATASYVLQAVSASYATNALSASYWSGSIENAATASYVLQAVSASYWSGSILNATSASYALTASYSNNTTSASYALTASYAVNATSASYTLTASYSDNATTSSYALTASYSNSTTSASYALTASYSNNTTSASYAATASYASNVPETASYALVALTASYASNVPVTSSYALTANTASYALTASYISGSGAGVGFPFSGSAVITGSLFVSSSFISGSFTGSLEGTASYATFALSASNAPGFTTNKTQSTPAVTWSFVHNLNTRNPLLQVYDSNYNQIIPNAIIAVDALTAEIRFDYSASGYAVASNGGGLYITGSTSRLDQTSAAVTWSFTHNLNTKYPAFEVYDSNDFVVIPSGIRVINENSAELYFAAPSTGKAIANFSGINGAPNATTASYSVTSEWNGLNAKPISSSLGTAAAASTTIVAQVATASYSAAFFDYAVISGSNSRAGTVMSVWNGGSVEYTDTSTSDIGNTDQVTMSVDLSGANVRLKSTTTSAWTVKSLIRLI
jgi:hypothetical protein